VTVTTPLPPVTSRTYQLNLVVVSISPEAQRAAAVAGQPAAVLQVYQLPQGLVQHALGMGAEITREGHVHLTHNARWLNRDGGEWVTDWPAGGQPGHLSERPTDAADALRLIVLAQNTRQLERDASAREALAEVLERAERGQGPCSGQLDRIKSGRLTPAEQEKLEVALKADADRVASAREAARVKIVTHLEAVLAGAVEDPRAVMDMDYEQRKLAGSDLVEQVKQFLARRADAQKIKAAQDELRRILRLRTLVREISTDPAVLGRLNTGLCPDLSLGLLPEEEALEMVRAAKLPAVLGASGAVGSFRLLTERDLFDDHGGGDSAAVEAGCDGECAGEEDADFTSRDPEELTGEEWRELQVIQAAIAAAGLPAGEVRLHVGTCACKDVGDVVRRVGVKVALDLGDGLVIRREYGVQ